ncbi:MAG: hypothetical protein M1831_000793 [Alyxoria varia]|nr:MAG: hypothetical protein M1831_000793 [Alyxoria varia]
MPQKDQDDAEAVVDEIYFPPSSDGRHPEFDGGASTDTEPTLNGQSSRAPHYDNSERPPDHHVVFIPGNPGLVSYYHPFLRYLHARLNSASFQRGTAPMHTPRDHDESAQEDITPRRNSLTPESESESKRRRIAVYGTSLCGFSVFPASGEEAQKLYDLADQISFIDQRLREYASRFRSSISQSSLTPSNNPISNDSPISITLLGHSIGAFFVLKLLERQYLDTSPGVRPYDIRAAVLLTPTIENIAHSANGLKATWALDPSTWNVLSPTVGLGAKVLVRKLAGERLARRAVAWWIGAGNRRSYSTKIEEGTRSSEDDVDRERREKEKQQEQQQEIDNAVRVSVKWLGSEIGVSQAMHMASRELTLVTDLERHFSHEFLRLYRLIPHSIMPEPATVNSQKDQEHATPAELFLYFAETDGWVSNTTRDSLVSRIQQSQCETKVRVEIDKSGTVPHAFCIGYSELVAEKCAEYLSGVL